MKKKVVVGMSGGVDSAVSALLLKEQGYDVIGLFMNNWEEEDNTGHCTADTDFADVRRVCDKLEIPYYSVNFAKQYMERVFEDFLKEYSLGRTPNPDVLCNREIKFGVFKDYAMSLGADYVATGHYADVETINGETYLKKAVDQNKDQTYFLNQVTSEQLKNVIFPLGKLNKSEVRDIAIKNGLVNAKKKDSTGICFIGERKFREFLQTFLPNKPGEIRDLQERVVGEHVGLMYYTIGQRRGLDIGGLKGGSGERWFVIKKDMENNVLYVSQGEDSELFSNGLVTYNINFIPKKPERDEFECFAKFRYRQPEQKVRVKITEDKITVYFAEPQRAITEGQWVVLYDEKYCLGGGVIEEKF